MNSRIADTSYLPAPPRAKRPWAYQTYQEFLDNKPTIKDGFSIIPYVNDAGIQMSAARIAFADSIGKKPKIWGFCDGNLVFILPPKGVLPKKIYYPLDYIGRYSFYTISKKVNNITGPSVRSLGAAGALTAAAAAARANSATYQETFIIDDDGNSQQATPDFLLQLFKNRPGIYRSYSDESAIEKSRKMIEYLVSFNESL
ncbi:MAG: hypothetical protein ABIX01_11510 [Chitinophagaceae bacterium]